MHLMRNAPFLAGLLCLASVFAFGQTPDSPTFEVASVKRTPPPEPNARVFFGPPRGGPGTSNPGQITWSNAALIGVLLIAYDVQIYQVTAPDWMNTERYDIVAKVPAAILGPTDGASMPPTSIPSAVEKQLGLKLTSTKGKLDVIVVHRAEKIPTEN